MRWPRGRARDPLWKPGYDELAEYNSGRAAGIVYGPEKQARMAELQRDYNKNYLPALSRRYIQEEA